MSEVNNQKVYRVVEADTMKPADGVFIILRIDNSKPARRAAEMYATMVEKFNTEEAYSVRHTLADVMTSNKDSVDALRYVLSGGDIPEWLRDRRGTFKEGGGE